MAKLWVCADCGEILDWEYEECWKCGASRETGRPYEGERPPLTPEQEAEDALRLKEMVAVHRLGLYGSMNWLLGGLAALVLVILAYGLWQQLGLNWLWVAYGALALLSGAAFWMLGLLLKTVQRLKLELLQLKAKRER